MACSYKYGSILAETGAALGCTHTIHKPHQTSLLPMLIRTLRLTHALLVILLTLGSLSPFVHAQPAASSTQAQPDYPLGAGDSLRIQVFQNPDLMIETRVSENGSITFPLIGPVQLGGLSIGAAEKKIADALEKGGFLKQPQVTIVLLQIRGNQVSVLGQVNRPGRFPMETANTRVTDMLANAGGTTATGDDLVIVSGVRNGKPFRKFIDIPPFMCIVPPCFISMAKHSAPVLIASSVI